MTNGQPTSPGNGPGTSPVTSPVIKNVELREMDFPGAMRAVIDGKKVTRVEWNDRNEFAVFKDNFLMIHTRGNFHTWKDINGNDLMATDWIEVK